MHPFVTRLFSPRLLLVAVVAIAVGVAAAAQAAIITYTANLCGPCESPVNASPGTGSGQVDVDTGAHTMHVFATFSGLTGNTSASHIHTPTAVAGAGTAGVATTTPTFAGFPLGVRAGTYEIKLNLLLASSYNPSFVTANGGTPASAEVALLAGLAAGKAYLNIHTTAFPGGEIRGFFTDSTTPTSGSTWGRIKTLYR
jgi:hypothetical protein